MAHISTEQALQIPQQLKQQGSHSGTESKSQNNKNFLSNDDVTLHRQQIDSDIKKIKVENYKNELGKDNAIVQETLKNKLSEYNLSSNTQLKVEKDMFGNLQIKGSLLQSDLNKITDDLNNSTIFKDSFARLSQQQPTLDYVDNVAKISNAYGVGNTLFNSLISDDNEFNKLNDIAHRFEAMKNTGEANFPSEVLNTFNEPDLHEERFQFTINA